MAKEFENIWKDPKFEIRDLNLVKLGDKFIVGDYIYRIELLKKISEQIQNRIDSGFQKFQILDLACANGRFTRAIEQTIQNLLQQNSYLQAEISGLDISKNMIETAKSTDSTSKIKYLVGDTQHLGQVVEKFSFDIISAAGLLFYLEPQFLESSLEQISNCMSLGGRFYFNCIDPNLFEESFLKTQVEQNWIHIKHTQYDRYQMSHFDSLGSLSVSNIYNNYQEILRLLKKFKLKMVSQEKCYVPSMAIQKNLHLQNLTQPQKTQILETSYVVLNVFEKSV